MAAWAAPIDTVCNRSTQTPPPPPARLYFNCQAFPAIIKEAFALIVATRSTLPTHVGNNDNVSWHVTYNLWQNNNRKPVRRPSSTVDFNCQIQIWALIVSERENARSATCCCFTFDVCKPASALSQRKPLKRQTNYTYSYSLFSSFHLSLSLSLSATSEAVKAQMSKLTTENGQIKYNKKQEIIAQ